MTARLARMYHPVAHDGGGGYCTRLAGIERPRQPFLTTDQTHTEAHL